MAAKRHSRIIALSLLAALLVFPPLTSVLADGLGIDLTHHHCASHDADDADLGADHDATHDRSEADPFQCDQCHVALVAIAAETLSLSGADALTPDARPALALIPVRAPPVIKPPIV